LRFSPPTSFTLSSFTLSSQRQLLTELYGAAVAGAQPEGATRTAVAALGIAPASRVHIIAIGKAAPAMASGAIAALAATGLAPVSGIVVASTDAPLTDPRAAAVVRVVAGDHPVPGP